MVHVGQECFDCHDGFGGRNGHSTHACTSSAVPYMTVTPRMTPSTADAEAHGVPWVAERLISSPPTSTMTWRIAPAPTASASVIPMRKAQT